MTKSNTSRWISAHLYYNEPLNNIIQQAVVDFIEKAKQTKLFEKYFFIRYWEKGPHIRLRLQVPENDMEKVSAMIREYFNEYFLLKPTYRNELQLQFEDWLPNNTVQFIDYLPETERYGGSKGVQLAEDLFHASSETVLQLMGNIDNWAYDHGIYFAIKMHAILLQNLRLTPQQIAIFMEYCFTRWLNLTVKDTQLSGNTGITEREALLQAFENSYQQQKETIRSLIAATSQEIEHQQFDIPFFEDWFIQTKQFAQAFHSVFESDQLTIPLPAHHVLPNGLKTHWIVFDSYIHMTNNRLGILNRDESFIYYLLWKSYS